MSTSQLEKRQFSDLEKYGVGALEMRDFLMAHPQPYQRIGGAVIWDIVWKDRVRALWQDIIAEGGPFGLSDAVDLSIIMNQWETEEGYALPAVVAANSILDEIIEDRADTL